MVQVALEIVAVVRYHWGRVFTPDAEAYLVAVRVNGATPRRCLADALYHRVCQGIDKSHGTIQRHCTVVCAPPTSLRSLRVLDIKNDDMLGVLVVLSCSHRDFFCCIWTSNEFPQIYHRSRCKATFQLRRT